MPKVPVFAPKTILCPLDLSAQSRAVLRWVEMFAKMYQAKVELLHVTWSEYPPYFLRSQTIELEHEVRQHRTALADDLARMARETLPPEISFEIAVLEGHPIDKILEYAKLRKADLIIMGSHGNSGVTRLRLGSVAENIVRAGVTPTLVVRARETAEKPKIARILCPVNFTAASQMCLKASAALARNFSAELLAMHAAESEGSDIESTREQLCRWVPEDVRQHCNLMEVVRHGNAAEQILLAAHEHAADLIILCAQHRRILDFAMLGSTTERVVRHANSAVLVIPAANGAAK